MMQYLSLIQIQKNGTRIHADETDRRGSELPR
jgi:hypothetical protein